MAEARNSSLPAGLTVEGNDFTKLLQDEFKPTSEAAVGAVEQAVLTLAREALSSTALIGDDVVRSIESMVAAIDKKMSDQINLILHHEEFQKLEGAWRGLHYLVSNTETDDQLKIRVMNVSKAELAKSLKRYKGMNWDQSPLFKRLYEEEYGQFGGEPYGCLVGDYHFDHSAVDVEMLGEMSKIAGAAMAPFIAGASPLSMGMQSWQELSNPSDIAKIFTTPEYAPWRALRESEDSKYLALAMPRFLARQPYGSRTDPVEEFDFEEDTGAADHGRYTWANAAYAMAANVTRSFKEWGWCSQIRGVETGGAVANLPTHSFPTDDGGIDMKCPTEVAISDRRENELSKAGFLPLSHRKNSDVAAFIGAQSLQKPAEYDDPDATANAALGARLQYLFATNRFGHYLKCIVRDKLGSFKDRESMERWLHDWIMQYVDGSPGQSTDEVKATKPLADASVSVEEVEGNPGYYTSKFYLRPHYQLEGLTISLRLVSKLPSAGTT